MRADEKLTAFLELEKAIRCENLNKSTDEQKQAAALVTDFRIDLPTQAEITAVQ